MLSMTLPPLSSFDATHILRHENSYSWGDYLFPHDADNAHTSTDKIFKVRADSLGQYLFMQISYFATFSPIIYPLYY